MRKVASFAFVLRGLITYLLLTSMLVHATSQLVIIADYVINTEFITKVFCFNKEKPQLKCNGKCHLAKELQKDKDQKSEQTVQKAELLLFYQCSSPEIVYNKVISVIQIKQTFYYSRNSPNGSLRSVFHPPSSVV